MKTTVLLTICLSLYVLSVGVIALNGCQAEEIPTNQAIRAIIGESSSEGYHGMLAISVAIRNRGSLRGVYGVNNPIVDKQPRWVWQMAERAWTESEHNQLHSGSFWESTDFPVPGWADKMEVVYRYKKHIFYRETK